MKENAISIVINASVSKVFEFTINPQNTPLGIKHIVKEEINRSPIGIGTVYKNVNKKGEWATYVVTDFKMNKLFEMKEDDSYYHVRYTYTQLAPNKSKLTYFEWKDEGELNDPFPISILENLKEIIEGRV